MIPIINLNMDWAIMGLHTVSVIVVLPGEHLLHHQPWNEFLLRFMISQCSLTVTSAVTGLPPFSLSRLRVCDLVSTSVVSVF